MTVVRHMPDVVVANLGTNSNVIKAKEVYGDAVALGMMGGTIDSAGNTYKIQVSNDEGTTWFDLKRKMDNAGVAAYVDLVPPAQGAAYDISEVLAYSAFRVAGSGSSDGATWKLNKKDTVYGA